VSSSPRGWSDSTPARSAHRGGRQGNGRISKGLT
jgi:hypothetical protein